MDFDEYLNEDRQDPESKAAYEALQADLCYQMSNLVEMARLRAGITQTELAKRMGTHQSAIARIESEANVPTLPFLERVAGALGLRLVLPRFASAVTVHARTDSAASDIDAVPSPFEIRTVVVLKATESKTTENATFTNKESITYA